MILEIYYILELGDLEAKENRLDQLIATCTKQLKQMTEDPSNAKYPLLRKFCHRNLFHVMQSELDWYCRSLVYDMNAVA